MTTQEPEIERPEETLVAGEETALPPPGTAVQREMGSVRDAVLGTLLYLAFFGGMTWFNAANLQFSPVLWAAIAPLTTVAYLLILVYTIRLICRLSMTARVETLAMVVALFIFLAINPDAQLIIRGILAGKPLDDIFATLNQPKPPALEVLVPFFLIVTGVYFGQLLSRIIREASLLVPVTLVSGLIDFWGVYWGPVGTWSEQAPSAVNMATAATAAVTVPEVARTQMPEQLQIFGSIAPPDSIGIGDFVFIAFFLSCAYRLGFSSRRTMWGIFLGLLAASLVMALDGSTLFGREIVIDYLPGLVFICGGALLANLSAWRLSRQEWAMTGVIAAILVALITVSIVQAEINKPRVTRQSFRLPETAKTVLLTDACRKMLGDAPADVLILNAVFPFENKDGKARLNSFELFCLARPPQPQLRTTREVYIFGRVSPSNQGTWEIIGETKSPPESAVATLKQWQEGDPLTLVRQAQGLPLEVFSLLDTIESEQAPGDDQFFILELLPDRLTLYGDRLPNEKSRRVVRTYDPAQFGGR